MYLSLHLEYLLAFINSKFEFFGLMNAPATFQGVMNNIFSNT